MNRDGNDADEPVDAVSARERLRSGTVETPAPDNRRTRRAAAILFLLAFIGVPSVGYAFVGRDDGTSLAVGLILLAFVLVLGYLMVKTILRR
ncbi:hypothetical protein ACXYTP_15535 [Tsukamurella ocularis]|uniref:hypothetical protein n=1 Tax=Tsukamurella ocularis TaxID=1970234 RepID=UPI0039EE3329